MQWNEVPFKKFLRRRSIRKGKCSMATTNLLAQKIWSNDFFKICYHAGGSTEHLLGPKMKRPNEESSPSDTSTPKKRKTLAGEIRTYLLASPSYPNVFCTLNFIFWRKKFWPTAKWQKFLQSFPKLRDIVDGLKYWISLFSIECCRPDAFM